MLFNPDPTKQAIGMLFSRKRVDQNHPPVFFNNAPVGSASDYIHIREKAAKARKGIVIILHLSSHIPLDSLDQLYKLFIRPHFYNCDIIYHVPVITNPFDSSISLKYSAQSIESIQ